MCTSQVVISEMTYDVLSEMLNLATTTVHLCATLCTLCTTAGFCCVVTVIPGDMITLLRC